MTDLRIKTIGQIKKEFFKLELQGMIENTAIHHLDNALQLIRKTQSIKMNINQYTIKAV